YAAGARALPLQRELERLRGRGVDQVEAVLVLRRPSPPIGERRRTQAEQQHKPSPAPLERVGSGRLRQSEHAARFHARSAIAMPVLYCFGLGYVAEALARRLLAEGWRVGGSTRDAARRVRLEALGIDVAERPPAGATHLLSSVPPDAAGDPVLRAEQPIA